MTVKCHYRLSPAGQKAALLAGRSGAEMQVADLPLSDPSLLEHCQIDSAGVVSIHADRCRYASDEMNKLEAFDAHPENADAVILAAVAVARKNAELEAARQIAQKAERVESSSRRIDEDMAKMASFRAGYEADPEIDWYKGYLSGVKIDEDHPRYAEWRAAVTEYEAWRTEKLAERKAREEQAAQAKQAAIGAAGGFFWNVPGGYCDFTGYDIWKSGQERRWVGVFDQPKGISRFLDSPKGEHSFDVSGLIPGECIQVAGFDVSSKGRRRHESEWFGVVVKNDSDSLVVRACPTRVEALIFAAKMRKDAETSEAIAENSTARDVMTEVA